MRGVVITVKIRLYTVQLYIFWDTCVLREEYYKKKKWLLLSIFVHSLPSAASVALSAICFSRAAFVAVCLSLSSSMRRSSSA